MILAGYETTANALAFAVYLLTANPAKRDRLLAELDAYGRNRAPTLRDLDRSEGLRSEGTVVACEATLRDLDRRTPCQHRDDMRVEEDLSTSTGTCGRAGGSLLYLEAIRITRLCNPAACQVVET